MITHVANTEQRISFKEVQLKPKNAHGPAAAEMEVDEESIVDQLTGKNAPLAPRPRGKRKGRVIAEKDAKDAPVEAVDKH